MEQKNNIKGKATRIAMDAAIWATDHVKEIGIGVGLVSLAAISHHAGYQKGQREMVEGFNEAWRATLEEIIRGGDEWMK